MDRGREREFGMDRRTLLYLKWIINKDLPYRAWNSTQCHVAAWMGGEFGEVVTCICDFPAHLKLLSHCLLISYTQHKIKNLKN